MILPACIPTQPQKQSFSLGPAPTNTEETIGLEPIRKMTTEVLHAKRRNTCLLLPLLQSVTRVQHIHPYVPCSNASSASVAWMGDRPPSAFWGLSQRKSMGILLRAVTQPTDEERDEKEIGFPFRVLIQTAPLGLPL